MQAPAWPTCTLSSLFSILSTGFEKIRNAADDPEFSGIRVQPVVLTISPDASRRALSADGSKQGCAEVAVPAVGQDYDDRASLDPLRHF